MLYVAILGFLTASSLVLLVYPYFVYPLILQVLPRRTVVKAANDLSASMLFCVYNEASSLPEKLRNLQRLKHAYPELEILVYDDGSTDGSGLMLAQAGDLLTAVPGAGRTGKAAGMKKLAGMARGDILIFNDANVIIAEDAIAKLLPYYGDLQVGGVCGTLVYRNGQSSVTAEIGTDYWNLEERLRSLESRTGNVMGADGSIFSVRRVLYPDFPDSVLDDFTVSMNVIFAGKRLIKAPDVFAYEQSVESRDEELRRKMRIGARAWHTHAHMRAQLRRMAPVDRFKYASHKLLRWFGGVSLGSFMLFGFLTLAALSWPFALLAAAIATLTGLAAYRMKKGKLARLAEMVLAMFATLIGIWRGIRGRTVVTWNPAKSR